MVVLAQHKVRLVELVVGAVLALAPVRLTLAPALLGLIPVGGLVLADRNLEQ